MEAQRIRELLQPFLSICPVSCQTDLAPEKSADLQLSQIENISAYLDLLLRWNLRINLTAIRKPEEIVTRHFGESLFAARYLFSDAQAAGGHVIDVGSGAGFPGVPIKIWVPGIRLTLIESNHKKATFLHELVRKLALTNVEVFAGRAEEYKEQAEVVTLRAVERFEQTVPVALRLVRTKGQLALLIGESQVERARELAPVLIWSAPTAIPLSSNRVLLVGRAPEPQNQFHHESNS